MPRKGQSPETFPVDSDYLAAFGARLEYIRMESGEELDVEAAKLSEEDRAWIEARRKQ